MAKKPFKIVKKIVDEWDPMKLLAMECPDDEYHPEIEKITALLPEVKNVEELADKINQIFTFAFDKTMIHEECMKVAERILKSL